MTPTKILSSHTFDGQFHSVRTQTKLFAGKPKKTISITKTISEEDIFEEKFRREFPEYVERKKEKYTWKQFYQKRMEKKQKKQEKKMKKLVSKIGKSISAQRKSASKTKMIEIVITAADKKRIARIRSTQFLRKKPTTVPAITSNLTRQRHVCAPLQAATQIRRFPPTRIFTQDGRLTKKTAPLMRKVLRMLMK